MIITANDKLNQAKAKYDEALDLLKSGGAEDREKALKIRSEADALKADAVSMVEIEKARNEAIQSVKVEPEVQIKNEFRTLGEFLVAVDKFKKNGIRHHGLKYIADALDSKDLAEGTGETGGFLVPAAFQPRLLSVMSENAIVRPRATVIPMSSKTVTIPVLDQTGTTEGVPHIFGGMDVFWQAEASEKGQSEPVFRNLTLDAQKLVGYTRASDELLADSAISLEAFLTGKMGFAGVMSWKEDYSFLRGTGAGQPLGVLNANVTTSVNRDSNTAVTFEDLANMQAAFYSANNAGVWVASQSLKAKLMTMKGPDGNPAYLWGDVTNGTPDRLLGYPIFFTLDQLPRDTATSTGSLLLADFSYYLIGDRQNMTIESSVHERFRFDQTAWRVVKRVDGQPWLSAPITSVDGVTTVSPFVVLAPAAS